MLRTSELFTLESRPVPTQYLASLVLSLVFCGAFTRAKENSENSFRGREAESFNLSFVRRRVELSNEEFVIFQHHIDIWRRGWIIEGLTQELAMFIAEMFQVSLQFMPSQTNVMRSLLQVLGGLRVRGEFKLWPPNSCASGPTILVRMAGLWVSRQIRASGHCPPHHDDFPSISDIPPLFSVHLPRPSHSSP